MCIERIWVTTLRATNAICHDKFFTHYALLRPVNTAFRALGCPLGDFILTGRT